jgi:hypothetical protein
MTSSVRVNSAGGTARPSAFAVLAAFDRAGDFGRWCHAGCSSGATHRARCFEARMPPMRPIALTWADSELTGRDRRGLFAARGSVPPVGGNR